MKSKLPKIKKTTNSKQKPLTASKFYQKLLPLIGLITLCATISIFTINQITNLFNSRNILHPNRINALANTPENSLRFYGNGKNNIDRVKISLQSKSINIGASDFTLEWWMKASLSDNPSGNCQTGNDNWITGNVIIDRDIYFNGDYGDYGVSLHGGKIAFGVNNGTSGTGICSTKNIADNQWHHIAIQRRSIDGYIWLYIDGLLDQQVNGVDGNISYRNNRTSQYPNDPYLVLGAEKHDVGSNYPSYNGFIDELRVSNNLRYLSAFTPNNTPFQLDAQTIALYHFNENSSTTLTDDTNQNPGTINIGGNPTGPIWTNESPFNNTSHTTPTPTSTPQPNPTSTPTITNPTPTLTPTIIPNPTSTQIPTITPVPSTSTNQALIFDGINDYITGPFLSNPTNFTFETWIRPSTKNQNSIIFANASDNSGWSLELNNGRIKLWMHTASGWTNASHSTTIQSNTWYHIAFTLSNSTARVFVNGSAGTTKNINQVTQGPSLTIGGLPGYNFFTGQIDEIRLSNNIRYSTNFTRPNKAFNLDQSTIALYHLNNITNQIISDETDSLPLFRGATNLPNDDDPGITTSTAPTN